MAKKKRGGNLSGHAGSTELNAFNSLWLLQNNFVGSLQPSQGRELGEPLKPVVKPNTNLRSGFHTGMWRRLCLALSWITKLLDGADLQEGILFLLVIRGFKKHHNCRIQSRGCYSTSIFQKACLVMQELAEHKMGSLVEHQIFLAPIH